MNDVCPKCGVEFTHHQHPTKPPGVIMFSSCNCKYEVRTMSTAFDENIVVHRDITWPRSTKGPTKPVRPPMERTRGIR